VDTLDPRDENPDIPALPGMRSPFDPWNYRSDSGWSAQFDIVGYHVEATDGGVGKIAEASHARDESFLVVDTGPWIFGKKVMIPAGTITSIDHSDRKVYVDRSKAQIKSCPDFDPDMYTEQTYRDKISGYFDDTYGGGVR
jgi:hypothetical protein